MPHATTFLYASQVAIDGGVDVLITSGAFMDESMSEKKITSDARVGAAMAHSFSPLLVHTAFSSLSLVVFPWLLMIKWTPSPLAPVRRNKNQACRWTEQSFPGQVVGKPLLFSFIPHSIVPCITGGVSVGDRDLIKPLLAAHGTIHFGRVLMKPGKPLTFATLELPSGRQLLVFGLPGGGIEFALNHFGHGLDFCVSGGQLVFSPEPHSQKV